MRCAGVGENAMTGIWLAGLSLVAGLLLACTGLTGAANADNEAEMPLDVPLNEQVLSIPCGLLGSIRLEVTLLTPKGPGPFPLAIMNHGADGSKPPRLNQRYRTTSAAYYFLSRGYAVALPMMQGFAGSGGEVRRHGCDLETIGVNNAKDIGGVIDFLSSFPTIDASKVIVAGQSFGGWNALAVGTLKDPRVVGLINFAGGIKPSDCPTPESSLAAAAGSFAKHTNIPSIWFYGDNDKVFSPSTWHAMYDSYKAAYGDAELVAYGNFMGDSHNLLGYPEGMAIWVPKVDAFLARVGLPNRPVNPEYLPTPVPPPTRYAAVDDVGAVPYLNDQGRDLYRKFLAKPLPRAFVFAPSGSVSSFSGGLDPLGKALRDCRKRSQNCQPYAIDDYVVWVTRMAIPAATHFARLDDPFSVPYLNDKGRQGYQKFLKFPKPRAFAISPDGSWSASTRGSDPLSDALQSCGKAHQNCRLYAVDEDVVWVEEMESKGTHAPGK